MNPLALLPLLPPQNVAAQTVRAPKFAVLALAPEYAANTQAGLDQALGKGR